MPRRVIDPHTSSRPQKKDQLRSLPTGSNHLATEPAEAPRSASTLCHALTRFAPDKFRDRQCSGQTSRREAVKEANEKIGNQRLQVIRLGSAHAPCDARSRMSPWPRCGSLISGGPARLPRYMNPQVAALEVGNDGEAVVAFDGQLRCSRVVQVGHDGVGLAVVNPQGHASGQQLEVARALERTSVALQDAWRTQFEARSSRPPPQESQRIHVLLRNRRSRGRASGADAD